MYDDEEKCVINQNGFPMTNFLYVTTFGTCSCITARPSLYFLMSVIKIRLGCSRPEGFLMRCGVMPKCVTNRHNNLIVSCS
ncbi:hypothetical protein GDO78_014793 [Eleutherodactylus coqui]|uniref:Uncharacterized protein n=1 Tax=Eleutherodactylus coqui TaxID=57060 RepID=A0A8J6B2V4_ELECQ|nr:hypothetical protein GDO78_014793 [Eleutherodactylus coqui]